MNEKIRELVENMFTGLPKTQEVVEVKLGIIENMQEKYLMLLQEGKNEYEAFGVVVAQFGSIDELKRELNITENIVAAGEGGTGLGAQELAVLHEEYKIFTKKFSIAIAVGVALCIVSPVVFLLLDTFSEFLATGLFLGIIAVAVSIFIIFGVKSEYYEDLLNIKNKKSSHGDNENDPIVGAIYLGATAVFLLLGFLGNWWHPGWLVYLLATAIVMLYNASRTRKI